MTSEETITTRSGGRPKKSVKRDIVKGVRFTKAEFYVAKQKAAKAGIGISSFIRQMAINGKIKPLLDEEERQFVRQLIGIANNLNQLTKKGHQEGFLTAVLMFEKYKSSIDELLQKLKR
ncbi:MAG: plasmid mobilization protein [Ginsengibacter sp.]